MIGIHPDGLCHIAARSFSSGSEVVFTDSGRIVQHRRALSRLPSGSSHSTAAALLLSAQHRLLSPLLASERQNITRTTGRETEQSHPASLLKGATPLRMLLGSSRHICTMIHGFAFGVAKGGTAARASIGGFSLGTQGPTSFRPRKVINRSAQLHFGLHPTKKRYPPLFYIKKRCGEGVSI